MSRCHYNQMDRAPERDGFRWIKTCSLMWFSGNGPPNFRGLHRYTWTILVFFRKSCWNDEKNTPLFIHSSHVTWLGSKVFIHHLPTINWDLLNLGAIVKIRMFTYMFIHFNSIDPLKGRKQVHNYKHNMVFPVFPLELLNFTLAQCQRAVAAAQNSLVGSWG